MYKNILIIKMSSLGDILHALPALYNLRKNYPEARISWAVHENFAAVLPGKPYIDEIVIVERKLIKNPAYIWSLRRRLRAAKYDLVLDLQGLAKSALVAFLTGTPEKYGYWEMREGSQYVVKPIVGEHKNGHVIERYLDVLRFLGCSADEIEFPLADIKNEEIKVKKLLSEHGVSRPYIVLVPGTRGESKKWPLDYWASLAKMIIEYGYNVVLAGARAETEMGLHIEKQADSSALVNLVARTSLLELMALIKGAVVHVSCDTGPLHIANALGTPIIAMFGPNLPDRTGPYGNKPSTIITAQVDCAGCLERTCKRDWICMPSIMPETVFDAVKELQPLY